MSHMSTFVIRPASPDDMDALIELCAEHAAYEGARYDPQGKASSLARALFATPARLGRRAVRSPGRISHRDPGVFYLGCYLFSASGLPLPARRSSWHRIGATTRPGNRLPGVSSWLCQRAVANPGVE